MILSNETAKDTIVEEIDRSGCCLVPDVVPPQMLPRLKADLVGAIEAEARSPYKVDYGMVLLCSLYPGSLIEALGLDALMAPIEQVLSKGCILYAYTSSSMPPGGGNYSNRIHVDCPRLIPGYRTNMGAMILLDDFTEQNGATWFLPGSHQRTEAPSEEYFYQHAKRLIAPAGSVFFLDPRLWHAGGRNETGAWRHAVTINMCRPYMKQRIDIPRAMAHMDLSGVPEKILQKLGFLSQTPANYEEYYAPPHLRKFRQPYE